MIDHGAAEMPGDGDHDDGNQNEECGQPGWSTSPAPEQGPTLFVAFIEVWVPCEAPDEHG